MKNKTWNRLLINIIFIVLVLVFSVRYASRLDWTLLAKLHVSVIHLTFSIGIGVIYLFLSAFIWIRMLYRLNSSIRLNWDLLSVYAKSWMGRYIPGKVVWIAGKIHFASRYGIPASQLGIAALLEAGVQMATQLIISMFIILFDGHFSTMPESLRYLTVVAIAGLIVTLTPPVFNQVIAIFLRLTKRQVIHNINVTFKAVGEMAGYYSIGYILLGIAYFIALRSFLPSLEPSLFLFTTAGISIAGAMGILALFAPSGLGVREGFIVLFLSMVIPVEHAVAAAIILRILTLLMDFAFLGVCTAGAALNASRRRLL